MIREYIRLTDTVIKDQEVLYHKLLKDPFLMLYFGQYYTSTLKEKKKMIAYDFFGGNTIQYKIRKKYQREVAPLLRIEIVGKAAFTEQQKEVFYKQALKKGFLTKTERNKKCTSSIIGNTIIDEPTGQIQSIEAEQLLIVGGKQMKKQMITIKKL